MIVVAALQVAAAISLEATLSFLGLGLPISATIIGAHGGRIWAESGPTGATFYFALPVSGGA